MASWLHAMPLALVAAVPFAGSRAVRSSRPPLRAARALALRPVVYMLVLLVGVLLSGPESNGRAGPWLLTLLVIALGVSGVLIFRNIGLGGPEADPAELLVRRTDALAQLAGAGYLSGLVGAALGGGPAAYVTGMAATVALLAMIAPTDRRVEEFAETLRSRGYEGNVVAIVAGRAA